MTKLTITVTLSDDPDTPGEIEDVECQIEGKSELESLPEYTETNAYNFWQFGPVEWAINLDQPKSRPWQQPLHDKHRGQKDEGATTT